MLESHPKIYTLRLPAELRPVEGEEPFAAPLEEIEDLSEGIEEEEEEEEFTVDGDLQAQPAGEV